LALGLAQQLAGPAAQQLLCYTFPQERRFIYRSPPFSSDNPLSI
jgi:hypothetical protein